MKKLIFIIILINSVYSYGQIIISSDTLQEYRIYNEPIIIMTSKLLFEYEKDCYNDSTIDGWLDMNGDFIPIIADTYILDTINFQFKLVKTNKYYRHTEPTFKGFIKWLHKKYKCYEK